MNIPVVLLSESFLASFIGARDDLSLVESRPRMLAFNVFLQLSLAGALSVTEWAVGMFLFYVVLQLGVGCEALVDSTSVGIDTGQCAVRTEESWEAVYAVFMLAQTSCAVESSATCFGGYGVDVCTRVWSKFEMVGTDVSLEGLVLAKRFVARWIGCAFESVLSFMRLYMSAKSCSRQEILCTAFPIASVRSFIGVGCFDVLSQVFLIAV